MPQRVTGYHYSVGQDGRKHRVYSNAAPKRAAPRRSYASYRRAAPVMRGSGGYYQSKFVKFARKYVPRGTFAAAGTAIGAKYGNPGIGAALGSGLAKIAGFGAYKVSQNSLVNEGQSPAYMHSTSSSVFVRHREYIADVISSSSSNVFVNQSYAINPGLSASFPWLSAIAQQYENYMLKGVVYEYKTLSADAVASSQANMSIGGVIMATDYNPLNGGFTNKQQMDNTQYTTSDKPSCSFYHAIECAPNSMPTKQLYVRTGAVPANADQRLYDLGTFNIASFGIPATSVTLGELWCTYEIEFIKPVSLAASGTNVLSDHFRLGTVAAATPLGTSSVAAAGCTLGGTLLAGTQYTFPSSVINGSFMFVWVVNGSSTASLTSPSISANSGSRPVIWTGDTTPGGQGPQTSATGASLMVAFTVNVSAVNGGPASVSFGTGGTLPASISSGDLWVTQLSPLITN